MAHLSQAMSPHSDIRRAEPTQTSPSSGHRAQAEHRLLSRKTGRHRRFGRRSSGPQPL
jgi:hypothetical protein